MIVPDTLKVWKLNETFLKIECDAGIMYELKSHFSYEVAGARFHPKVKARVWDGRINLFSLRNSTLPVGLFEQLVEYCKARDYELLVGKSKYGLPREHNTVTMDELIAFVEQLNITSAGDPITFRDYQYAAILACINDNRHVVLSPTASGKSAIIYVLVQWYKQQGKSSLIVVPTTQLVAQMASDFNDYSETMPEYKIDTHMIYAGKSKDVSESPVVCSTWQSIYKFDKAWYSGFDVVIVDEVHSAKGASLSKVMENCEESKVRLGFTGSLDKIPTHKQQLIAMFGDVIRVAKTADLIDKGYLSSINIKCLVMKYGADTGKVKLDYQKELDFLVTHSRRNHIIKNLALSLTGNTLILYNFVEKHGQVIHDLIVAKDPSRQVFFVHGGVAVDDREDIREATESGKDVVIIASFGTFSTGVNIKRLHNIILASPTKSVIRLLQSIGRGLRKAHDKDKMTLFDLSDMLTSRKKKNFTYEHFVERLGVYNEEGFQYTISEMQIE
jgi:superfamily II DNA or RNA helicase